MEVRNAVDFSRLPPVTLCKKIYIPPWGFPGGSDSKESACNAGDLGWEDILEEEMTTALVFLPGELQSTGLQRVEHN